MNVWVVLPTYNERENLAGILRSIFSQPLPGLSGLVVDDGSPDGTGERAEQLRGAYPTLFVLHRKKKRGLARAYVDGFRDVLARGATHIFEMDADFSHDPALLPVLLQRATSDADLVLGSRYVPGGAIRNWNWPRRFVSRIGNWYARHILNISLRDLTGGYKCFRRTVLESIDLATISSTGYNFQIELTWKALIAGFRIVEEPITFTERRLGRSKFHFGIILESMIGVWALRRLAFTVPRKQRQSRGASRLRS